VFKKDVGARMAQTFLHSFYRNTQLQHVGCAPMSRVTPCDVWQAKIFCNRLSLPPENVFMPEGRKRPEFPSGEVTAS